VAGKRRDEQLEAADAALRRGDRAAAVALLAPLADAGVPRAQALLGRTHEEGVGRPANAFEAYVWYSLAARAGDAGALAARDRAAARLQPAELRQADQLVTRWKPRGSATGSSGP
jgi:TPR repeat protein